MSEIFLKISGVDGGSEDEGHKGEIEVTSVQWGMGRGVSLVSGALTREVSVPNFSDVTFTKILDGGSSALLAKAVKGDVSNVSDSATITFVRSTGERSKYLVVELEGVIISQFSQSSGGERPSESFSLNFTKITHKFFPAGKDGVLEASKDAGYDLRANKPV